MCRCVGYGILHERGRDALVSDMGARVDSADASGGKASGPHAHHALVDPVTAQMLAVAIGTAYLFLPIAGRSYKLVLQSGSSIRR